MAATPASSVEEPTQNNQEQITFRFCRECSNMLYPKEDLNNRKLMYACRTCQFSEEASSSCVFRNNLYNTVGETAGVTQDVGSDPTVGIPDFCTLCGQAITCPVCEEPPPDISSLCNDVLEEIMILEDEVMDEVMDEEECEDEGGEHDGDEKEDQYTQLQPQLGT